MATSEGLDDYFGRSVWFLRKVSTVVDQYARKLSHIITREKNTSASCRVVAPYAREPGKTDRTCVPGVVYVREFYARYYAQ